MMRKSSLHKAHELEAGEGVAWVGCEGVFFLGVRVVEPAFAKTGDLEGDLHDTLRIEEVGVMWRVTGPIFRASLSIGAEEDLGVPTKRNPARPLLFRKPLRAIQNLE